MADTSWGFNLPSLAPSIGEAIQMGEQKQQREFIQNERTRQQQEEDQYKRVELIGKATTMKDFATDAKKVDEMVNERLGQIKIKYSTNPEYTKLPTNILWGQLQQEVVPLMSGSMAVKSMLTDYKNRLTMMAKENPNLDVDRLTADMRDRLASDVIMIGPDGALNFKPTDAWKYSKKDLLEELTSERDYDASSGPFIERLQKEKPQSSSMIIDMGGGNYVTGKQTSTKYHVSDINPNEDGVYAKAPRYTIRADDYNGRKIATQKDLDEYKRSGSSAQVSGYRKAWSDNKAKYEKEMPNATENERERAFLYDMLEQHLEKPSSDPGQISRAPSRISVGVNTGKEAPYTRDIYSDEIKKLDQDPQKPLYFSYLEPDTQMAIRKLVEADPQYKDTPSSNIAIKYHTDGKPWVAVYKKWFDERDQREHEGWKLKAPFTADFVNVQTNSQFGQKSKTEAAKEAEGAPAPKRQPAAPARNPTWKPGGRALDN